MSSSLFGMSASYVPNFPTVPFSGMRTWDLHASWSDIETASGVFNWTKIDQLLAMAATSGKTVLYTFGGIPAWAADATGLPKDLNTGNTLFKEFVIQLVRRSLAAKVKISAYEVWNEPNLPKYWPGTPQQLAIMTTDVYNIVKDLDNSAMVIGPGGSGGTSVSSWIQDYYTLKVPQDAFNYHAYMTDGSRNPYAGMMSLLNHIHGFMKSIGLQNMPMWFCEGSWGNPVAYGTPLTDDEQIVYMSMQYIVMFLYSVQSYYWYAYDNYYGWGLMLGKISGALPVANSYALLQAWLIGSTLPVPPTSDPASNLIINSNGTNTLNITLASGGKAQIVWHPTATHSLSTAAKGWQTLLSPVVNPVKNGSVTASPKPILLTF